MRFWFSLAAVLVVDQLSKWAVASNLLPMQSVVVLPKVMWFTYVHNRGAAFSILQGQTVFLVVAGIVVVLALIAYNHWAKPVPILQVFIGIMAGGAVGNLLDRCLFGHVIDFIDFRVWPVFNIADVAISVGGALLLIYYIWFERDDPKNEG